MASWRTATVSDQDNEEWLARCHNTRQGLSSALYNATDWLEIMQQAKCPAEERERGIALWQHRVNLLQTKALLMGIQLE